MISDLARVQQHSRSYDFQEEVMNSRMRKWSLLPAEPWNLGQWLPTVSSERLTKENQYHYMPSLKACCFFSLHLSLVLLLPTLPSSSQASHHILLSPSFDIASQCQHQWLPAGTCPSALETWLDSITFSSCTWSCCKTLMGFLISSCLCWDICFSHVRKYTFS